MTYLSSIVSSAQESPKTNPEELEQIHVLEQKEHQNNTV